MDIGLYSSGNQVGVLPLGIGVTLAILKKFKFIFSKLINIFVLLIK